MGELVAEVGDFKFYIYEHKPKSKRGSAWKHVTIVNKNMKFSAVKSNTHTVGVGFDPIEKE